MEEVGDEDTASSIPILLVTANVGSIFEDVSCDVNAVICLQYIVVKDTTYAQHYDDDDDDQFVLCLIWSAICTASSLTFSSFKWRPWQISLLTARCPAAFMG